LISKFVRSSIFLNVGVSTLSGKGAVMRVTKENASRYAFAVAAAVAALYLRRLLNPLIGEQNPYHTIWLAIAFSAWYCGIGPSIVAVTIGVIGVWYWFLPPYHSFGGKDQTEVFGMLGFLVLSGVIAALGESTRRTIHHRQQAEEGLRRAQRELEGRVRDRTAALEQKTAEVVEKAALLDLATDAIFIKAADGTISYWNQGAERLYGWTAEEALGRSPQELLQTKYPVPLSEIEGRDDWAGELCHTTRDGARIVVVSRWTTLRNKDGQLPGWMEINTDITARKRAEDAARRLSGRILSLQDDERRRIARELHDGLGQYLTALKMNLHLLSSADSMQALRAAECSQIVDKCLTETRTISHLLHPPLLEEAGFGSAARWYIEGFAQRSGIRVNLDLCSDLGRLDSDLEIALFRALQETLTNVHRHSGGSAVDARLRVEGQQIRLEIKDNGRGVPQERLNRINEGDGGTGVGIAGIRERMRELGGCLQIQSDNTGTRVLLAAPLLDRQSADSAFRGRSSRVSIA
jgi:PAS domain S-box-containing protein